MQRRFGGFLFVLWVCVAPAGAWADCTGELTKNLEGTEPSRFLTPTENFEAYLAKLIQEDILKPEQFAVWIERLEAGELVNPIPLGGSAARIHHDGLQRQLAGNLNRAALYAWSIEKLELLSRARNHQEAVSEETRTLAVGRPMRFVPVGAGSFVFTHMTSISDRSTDEMIPTTLTHPIEVMDTVVTQGMWVKLMGDNPSRGLDHESPERDEIEIEDRVVHYFPDRPVNMMTWWSALEFANRVSIQKGLPPVYDLSEVWFDGTTSAAKGDLKTREWDGFRKLKINAPDGDIYRAEGVRLPTNAEYERLAEMLRQEPGYIASPADYSWYNQPYSSGGAKNVATTPRSLTVNGFALHDLIGNVNIWVQDLMSRLPAGGVNPLANDPDRALSDLYHLGLPDPIGLDALWGGMRGYSIFAQLPADYFLARSLNDVRGLSVGQLIGIRLVRTLK